MSDHQEHEQTATEKDRRKRVSRRTRDAPASGIVAPVEDARVNARPRTLRSQGEVGKAEAPDSRVRPASAPLGRAFRKPGPGTLAAGGMSPVADRKVPNIWAQSATVSAAGKLQPAPANGDRSVAPSEPIGGLVDTSAKAAKAPLAVERSPNESADASMEQKKDRSAGDMDSPNSGEATEPDEVAASRARVRPRTDQEDED